MQALADGADLYDCAACARSPFLYDALGHDGPPTLYPKNVVTGEPFAECPVRTMQRAGDREADELARYRDVYFPLFEAGHLQRGGGIEAQDARWLDGMQRIVSLRRAAQRKFDEVRASESAPPEGRR